MRRRIGIGLRDWLRLLARVTGRVRRALIGATFRHEGCLRPTPTPEERAAGLTAEARVGEHRLRLMASVPVCVSSGYEEWLARQELSPGSPPEPRLFFPLAEYGGAILPGLDDAGEWAHYLSVDRRLALDLFCPATASPPAGVEETDVLVIHATSKGPHAGTRRPA